MTMPDFSVIGDVVQMQGAVLDQKFGTLNQLWVYLYILISWLYVSNSSR